MCDLSGGQKVKVVVLALHRGLPARSSWTTDQRPGPRVAGRGVCLITQNEDFADANATETWAVAKRPEGDERSVAFCDVQGDPEWEKYAAEQEVLSVEPDTYTDAYGNTVKNINVPKLEDMTRKELKKYKKQVRDKVKRGEELEYHEQEWADAWNIDFD